MGIMTTQLDRTLESYEAAIKNLNGSKIEFEQVLPILHARDAVQVAFNQAKHIPSSALHIPSSTLSKLILSDAQLRDKAGAITKVIKTEEWENWRESVHPPVEAWWWRLDSIAPHPLDDWDWLWKLLSVAGWTANISLLVNIATRFLAGGGVGLIGVGAVALPSILTLLQASSELTKFGEEGFTKLLDKKIPIWGKKIPKEYHQEVKLGFTAFMSIFLVVFWCYLPEISNIYNSNGLSEADSQRVKAERAKLQKQDLNGEGNILALAHLYHSNDLHADAIDLLSGFIQKGKSIQTGKSIQKGKPSSAVHQLLADIYQQVGLNLLAREQYINALKLAQTGKNLEAQAIIQTSLGDMDFSFNKFQDALRWYKDAQVSYQGLGDRPKAQELQEKVNQLQERL